MVKKIEENKQLNYVEEDMFINGDWQGISHAEEDFNRHYIVKYNKNKYLVKRIGECEYKKCKSICCKFFNISFCNNYYINFGKKSKKNKGININSICNKLCKKTGNCKIWDKKTFPKACKQFPHPNDNMYHEVMDKCTFKFIILNKLIKYKKKVYK